MFKSVLVSFGLFALKLGCLFLSIRPKLPALHAVTAAPFLYSSEGHRIQI